MHNRSGTSGNIIFLILLAVILFAALSYAVTESLKGGNKNASEESDKALAATIMQRLANTSFGLQRFLMMSGYKLETMDMAFSGAPSNSGNASSCAVPACNLYDPAGGNIPVPLLPEGSQANPSTVPNQCQSAYFNADGTIKPFTMIVSVKNVSTPLPEVALFYCGLKKSLCDEINEMALGDKTISALYWNLAGIQIFSGSHTNPMAVTTANQLGGVAPNDMRLSGATTFCTHTEYGYSLFHVVAER